jgi:hypothetical protein
MIWRPTPERRALAKDWWPSLLQGDHAACRNITPLVRGKPIGWLSVLAGMPSTRWIALLRPHGIVGQLLRCGPSKREVQDLGRVICGIHTAEWLLRRYPGPLNDTGQERLLRQQQAVSRLLSRCVVEHDAGQLLLAVHVAGATDWQIYHSPTWPAEKAQQALVRVFAVFDVFPNVEYEEHRL